MTRNHIKVEIDGPIASLIFNRPNVLNAFHNEAMGEIITALKELDADERVRAILVRGEGRAFSAGFDMKASAERDMSTIDHVQVQMERQFDFIMAFWDCPKPTIALVHGFCMAGAFEVALACDITIAAEGTRFGEPEVRFGTGIVAMLLPWAVLPKHAKEMLLTGNDKMDAARAHAIGIVNHVVPQDQLLPFGRAHGARHRGSGGPLRVLHQARHEPHLRDHGDARCAQGVARHRHHSQLHAQRREG